MVEYCVYYGENGERCVVHYNDPRRFDKVLPLGAKEDFPAEVKILGIPIIKREKNLADMTKKDWERYGHQFRYAAKDIPLSQAMPKEANC